MNKIHDIFFSICYEFPLLLRAILEAQFNLRFRRAES